MAEIKLQTEKMHEENERLTGKPKHIQLPEVDQEHADMPSYGKCLHCWGECCGFLRTWMPCLCCCFVEYPYKTVPQSYNGIYQKFGRYVKTVKPGLHYINPCT
jgi:erythrocyte band 7 integral membrane protein